MNGHPLSTISTPVRVAEVGVAFWAVKLLTTGTGETLSDFLVRAVDPLIVVPIVTLAFVACLAIQLTARRYVPWRYWLLVSAIAVFGTIVADVTDVVIGVPYLVSTIVFAAALAATLTVWKRTEGTISVHSITSTRRELFYWLTVAITFALGTASGDLAATTLSLGYLGSALLFTGLIVMPLVAWRFGLSSTIAFWWAYILTRPLGASVADGLAVSPTRGGLGLGTLPISAVGIAIIVGAVGLMTLRRRRLSGEIP